MTAPHASRKPKTVAKSMAVALQAHRGAESIPGTNLYISAKSAAENERLSGLARHPLAASRMRMLNYANDPGAGSRPAVRFKDRCRRTGARRPGENHSRLEHAAPG